TLKNAWTTSRQVNFFWVANFNLKFGIVQGTMTLNDFNNYFDVELESDDVDTIAGYYLTGVGTIPTTEKLSYELVSQNKQFILTNDKVKNGRVTKVKVQITEVEIEEETE
ncbi:transporter associated domain-containing protein, partial [Streptococcus pneumoniae]|nr:transporter associated domain-containing protein [Streptococcus pneumoniae]